MKLLIALAVGIVLYFLVSFIYKRYWHRGLNIAVEFENDVLREGESNSLIEKIANNKILPISILQVRFAITKTFKFAEEKKNSSVTDQNYRSDFFSVMPYQKVTRTYPFTAVKRGCFQLSTIDVFGIDFFISKARRMSLKTPKLVYVLPKKLAGGSCPESVDKLFDDIKSSEDNNKKMVVLLNTELNSMSNADELIEDGIKIADYLVTRSYKEGVKIKLFTNALDMITGEDCRTGVVAMTDDEASLEKTLARIETDKPPKAFRHLLTEVEELDKFGSVEYVIISNNRKQDFIKAYNDFAEKHSTMLIIPEFKNVDIAPFEDGEEKIVKWVLENDY